MMSPATNTDWLPGIIMLLSGGVIGAALVWWSSKRKGRVVEPAVRPLELRELVAKRDALVDRLRELEDTASKRTPEQLAEERYAVELEAAAVMRAIDLEVEEEDSAEEPEVSAVSTRKSGVAGFVWGIVSAGAIVGLFFFVSNAAKDRQQGMPVTGQPGTMSSNASSGGQMPHPDVATLEQRVKQNPEDLESRLTLAQMYLIQNNLMGTYEQTQYVLQREPENPVAMAYQAIVKLAMGAPDDALKMLDRAIELDPGLLDAWAHKAIALASIGRTDEAEKVVLEAEKRFPQNRDTLEGLLGEIRGVAARGGAQAPPMGGSNTQASTPEPAAAPAVGGADRVSGTITLDPAARVQFPATLFVDARAEGVTSGPPVAVVRLVVTSFPLAFSLGPENAMMGGSLPAKVRVEARIDTDGNAMTRDAGAPSGVLDHVALGSNDLTLVLK